MDRAAAVVVVVGASSGIGLSVVRAFAVRGDHLVLASRSAERLSDVAEQCLAGGAASALAVVTDVRDEASVDALLSRAVAEHGRVDVVVHAASVMAYGPVREVPAEVFRAVVDTAILGTFHVSRAALGAFGDRGHLVVVSSVLATIAAPDMSSYVTGKWGQAGLVRVLQIENRRPRQVHISLITPGSVNTPIYAQAANVTGRLPRPPIPVDPPEKVARAIVRCVVKPRPRVSTGLANPAMVFGFRALPGLFDALVRPLLRVFSLRRKGATPTTGNVFTPQPAGESEHGPWTSRWRHPL
jgi:NAD(P)-dependent dehydrogenase (short-subunit alcohol dehydrogenase family)